MNVYPEDIENVFEGLAVKEFCIFASHYLWSGRSEELVMVVRSDGREFEDALVKRNRRLPDFKRIHGYVPWDEDFPRTASLKIKRQQLADAVREAGPDGVVAV